VHHAYLFSGPRGCGKTSSARILARSLNCESGPTPDPCGVCASCIALSPSGPGSIDVIEIDAASHGGVDDARDLRERAFYAPVSGRFKIYIIDEAHMVTREGFNALLKLVEEPPPHLKFVFATTEPEKVISTIRSRTHHYPFRLVPPAVLRELLEQILAAEKVAYEPAVLPVVIRAGAGSVRDSLSVLDQLIAGSDDSGLRYDRAAALLGYTDDTLLDEVTEAFAAGDGAAVFGAIDRVVEGGHDPRRFAADLLDRLRDLIVLAAVPDAGLTGLLDVPADRLERMRDQAKRFGQAHLVGAAERISAGLVEMRGATSPRLQLELMCAQVLLPAPGSGERGMLARLERLERHLDSGAPVSAGGQHGPSADQAAAARQAGAAPDAGLVPAEVPVKPAPPDGSVRLGEIREPAASAGRAERGGQSERGGHSGPAGQETVAARSAPEDSAPAAHAGAARGPGAASEAADRGQGSAANGSGVDASLLRDRWPGVLDAVKNQRRVAWILLGNASVETLADGVLTLRFDREGEAKGFSASGYDRDLVQVLQGMFGISPHVRTVFGGGPGQGGPGRGPAGLQPGSAAPGEVPAGSGGGSGPASAPHRPAGQAGGPEGTTPHEAGVAQGSETRHGGGQAGTRPDVPQAGAGPAAAVRAASAGAGAGQAGDSGGTAQRRGRPQADAAATARDAAVRAAGAGPGAWASGVTGASEAASRAWNAQPDDAEIASSDVLSGTDLIVRELGGQMISELGEP
jgi:DNA polymerase-3 subunit gamma/tau